MNRDNHTAKDGFVVAADEGPAFWFLNTLTINKVGATDTAGQLSIVDHRVPPGFAPPPHVHQVSDEAFFVPDGEVDGFCGDRAWQAGPGSLVFLPCAGRGKRLQKSGLVASPVTSAPQRCPKSAPRPG